MNESSIHPPSKLPYLFLALTMVQAIHSVEEIIGRLYEHFPVVSGYIHNKISLVPVLRMSGITFAIGNLVIVMVLSLVTWFLFRGIRGTVMVARVIGALEILNGAAHIGAAIYTGGYFTGSISGAALIILGAMVTRAK